jgi:YfiH family protein
VSFAWDSAGEVPLLRFTAGPPGVRIAFSSRRGGVSDGPYDSLNIGLRTGDEAERVIENRRRAITTAGGDPAQAAGCRQIHSADLHEVSSAPPGAFLDPGHRAPPGDGLVTARRGLTLVAQGADCLTVGLVSDGEPGRAAMVHAGWAGLLAGVLEAAVRAVGEGAVCAVGPGAGPCCYAVRADVGDPLRARFGDDVVRDGRADLWLCAERSLEGAGAGAVHVARECTMCLPERYFSHRRDGAPGGRQAGFALLEAA